MLFCRRSLVAICLLPMMAEASVVMALSNDNLLLYLVIMLLGAALSWQVTKWRLPNVVGELLCGIALGILAHYKIGVWPQLVHDQRLTLLAELGSILLLFEIGLESSLAEIKHVGKHGTIVALVGVGLPLSMGVMVLPLILFGHYNWHQDLFLGATLAATSTGVSARVFKDLGIIATRACQVVLAASVIDDILGLVILAAISALVISGSISLAAIGLIGAKVIVFFMLSYLLSLFLPRLIQQLLRIQNDDSMVMVILIGCCLTLACLAASIGLATIIGAFIAGLLLEVKLFNSWAADPLVRLELPSQAEAASILKQRLVNLVRPWNFILVPVFFVYAGMQVDIIAASTWSTLSGGIILSVVAIISKLGCGLFMPRSINRWVVGLGMVPRGEIGLIFALTGRALGIFSSQILAMILIMIIITSLITPLGLQLMVARDKHENKI